MRRLRRFGGRGQAVRPLPVSGCHLVSLGRRAVRRGHRAPSIARIPKQPCCCEPLPRDRPGCRDPRRRDSAPGGQHGCRPQRRTAGTTQVMQGQQSSRWCRGWLGGPRSGQSLKAQQPHRWAGVVAGVLVKKEGDHPPQQCAGCLQCQHSQPQGQGHLALPWAGPRGRSLLGSTGGGLGQVKGGGIAPFPAWCRSMM